jgi:hypothetical protein
MRSLRLLLVALLLALAAPLGPAQAAADDAAWFSRPGVPERGLALTNRYVMVGRKLEDSNGVAFATVSYVLFEPSSGAVRYVLASDRAFYGNLLLPASELRQDGEALRAGRPQAALLAERHYSLEELEKHYPPRSMRERELNLPFGTRGSAMPFGRTK